MKTKAPAIVAATFVVVAAALPNPASADIWWETESGTYYWDDVVGSYGVFRLLKPNKEEVDNIYGIFIDGLASQYSGIGVLPGTYDAIWFDYREVSIGCPSPMTDPYGTLAPIWGRGNITFEEDYNYFAFSFTVCDAAQAPLVLYGTPGL